MATNNENGPRWTFALAPLEKNQLTVLGTETEDALLS
jgi:hypothetical protein